MSDKRALPPDQDQRELIVNDLDTTMLVEAAAGTGKTTSMLRRMVNLIATGKCGIDRMAAVTFTRKAAAELRAKFQVALEGEARGSDGNKRERLADALDRVDSCYIGTIHSFCAKLLRERPLEAGVGLAFEELEEETDARIRRDVWDMYVAELFARNDPLLEDLEELGIHIGDLSGAYDRLSQYPDVEEWPAGRVEKPDLSEARDALIKYANHMNTLIPSFPRDRGNDKRMYAYEEIVRMTDRAEIRDPENFSAPDLVEIMEKFCKTTKVVQSCWPGKKETAVEESRLWDEYKNNYADQLVRQWRAHCYEPLMRLIRPAVEMYERRKEEEGGLNFQDLLMKAAALLKDKPHVRRYFRARYTHVLVDEFQDTDPVQARVMMYLTAGDTEETDWRKCRPVSGSLFVVGDPKQSIYRFRRADIVTYNQVKKIIEECGGKVVSLSASFRTVKPLIAWTNDVFSSVFPEAASEYQPQRRDLMPGRAGGSAGTLTGLYKIIVPDGLKEESVFEYEADKIARYIRKALDEGMTVPRTEKEAASGTAPEATPGDFMIITYKKERLSVYARKLDEYGIPHQVTGGSSLNEVSQLDLLCRCLKAVAQPDNPVALVAVLRSGLFGISDEALYDFKAARGIFSYRARIPDKGISVDDREQIKLAFDKLRMYAGMMANLPAAAAAESIAADLGLFAQAAASEGGNVQVGSMAKAIELLRSGQEAGWSFSQLIERLEEIIGMKQAHDGIPAKYGDSSVVRVMNLHKAKGLEAPVVFLAGASGKKKVQPVLHVDRTGGKVVGYVEITGNAKEGSFSAPPVYARPEGWEAFAEEEARFEVAEAERLMYVAATRAGTQLTIVERVGKQAHSNVWKYFGPYMGETGELADAGLRKAPAKGKIKISKIEVDEGTNEIRDRWLVSREPTYDTGAAKAISVELDSLPYPADERGAEWGEVIHALFQSEMDMPDGDLKALAVSLLEEKGLGVELADQALGLVAAVTRSDVWRRAQESGRRYVEMPFQVMLPDERPKKITDEILVRGVIDLVFEEAGGWVIVDYKTDDKPGKDVGKLYEHYLPQLKMYARAWEKCTGIAVREIGLYFTHTGKYMNQQV